MVVAPLNDAIDLSDGSIEPEIDEAIFKTKRSDPLMLELQVSQGITASKQYSVRLYFAELDFIHSKFTVSIEGQSVLTNYDPLQELGHRFKGIVKTFTVTAGLDGDLDIKLEGQDPFISAIEVVEIA